MSENTLVLNGQELPPEVQQQITSAEQIRHAVDGKKWVMLMLGCLIVLLYGLDFGSFFVIFSAILKDLYGETEMGQAILFSGLAIVPMAALKFGLSRHTSMTPKGLSISVAAIFFSLLILIGLGATEGAILNRQYINYMDRSSNQRSYKEDDKKDDEEKECRAFPVIGMWCAKTEYFYPIIAMSFLPLASTFVAVLVMQRLAAVQELRRKQAIAADLLVLRDQAFSALDDEMKAWSRLEESRAIQTTSVYASAVSEVFGEYAEGIQQLELLETSTRLFSKEARFEGIQPELREHLDPEAARIVITQARRHLEEAKRQVFAAHSALRPLLLAQNDIQHQEEPVIQLITLPPERRTV